MIDRILLSQEMHESGCRRVRREGKLFLFKLKCMLTEIELVFTVCIYLCEFRICKYTRFEPSLYEHARSAICTVLIHIIPYSFPLLISSSSQFRVFSRKLQKSLLAHASHEREKERGHYLIVMRRRNSVEMR